MRKFFSNPIVQMVLIFALVATLLMLEGLTLWNTIYPPPAIATEHPFLAGIYLVVVVNVTGQVNGVNVSIRWNGWNDTWVWFEYVPPSSEGRKMFLNRDDQFQLLLKPNMHAQIDFYAYSYDKQENYTVSVNVYSDGSKDLGPWHRTN